MPVQCRNEVRLWPSRAVIRVAREAQEFWVILKRHARSLDAAPRDKPDSYENETVLCSLAGARKLRGAFHSPYASVPTDNTSSGALPVRISTAAGANS